MADPKQAKLSLVIRTVDQATAKIKAINDRLDAITKPVKDFKKALGELREKSGLDNVIGGIKGVGSAIGDLLGKVAVIGGVLGAATAGVMSLIDGFDQLGDKAEHLGVGVDWLAQTRYAAKRAGVEIDQLDNGVLAFSKSLGQARAGTGRMAAFLQKVSPPLLKQLKATKSNEEAFDLLADAMHKLEDPAKRAALATATVGDAELGTLLFKGSKGIAEMRARYLELAGTQEDAAGKAGEVDDAMVDLHASMDGAKAAIVSGLAPALKVIVEQLRDWFTAHREDIAEWAKQIGEKLPSAVKAVAEWIGRAYDKVSAFIDAIGGMKTVAIAAGAALIAGPVIAIGKLAASLVTAISRTAQLAKGLGGLGGAAGGAGGGGLMAALGPAGLTIAAAGALNEATGGSLKINGPGGINDYLMKQMGADKFQGGPSFGDTIGQVLGAARASVEPQKAEIKIDIGNAPRGTRVNTAPQSTAEVDLSVGYQMGAAL